MIHVCFGLHDVSGHYSKFTGTTICSLFENLLTPPPQSITIHILHDNTLTQDNRDKFIYLARQYNQFVKFYNVEELCADKIAEFTDIFPHMKNSRVNIGFFYRLLILQVLPINIDKCIYLDSDTIVNLDIKELWQIELGDKIFATVPETLNNGEVTSKYALCIEGIVKVNDYFNSGVMLINLSILRNEQGKIKEGSLFCAKDLKYQRFADQDILNYCFSTRYLKLPIKFNRFVVFARQNKESALKGKIYHYVGSSNLGWGMSFDLNDPFSKLWIDYFVKTPWFNAETLSNFYKNFNELCQNIHVDHNRSMIKFSAALSAAVLAAASLSS